MRNKPEVSNSAENKEKKGFLKNLINSVTAFFVKEKGPEIKKLERLVFIKEYFTDILRAIMPTLALGDPKLSQQQVRPEDVILTEVIEAGKDEAIKCTCTLLIGEISFSVDSDGQESWNFLQNKTGLLFENEKSGYNLLKKILMAQSLLNLDPTKEKIDMKVDEDAIEVVLGKNYLKESKNAKNGKNPDWSSEASLGTKINAAEMAYRVIDNLQKGLPIPRIIIFSTGPTAGPDTRGIHPTEAERMLEIYQEILIGGLPPEVYDELCRRTMVIAENKSLSSLSNASETYEILKNLGISGNNEDSQNKNKEYKIGLNTLEFHLERCKWIFEDLCKALVEGSATDVELLKHLTSFREQLKEIHEDLKFTDKMNNKLATISRTSLKETKNSTALKLLLEEGFFTTEDTFANFTTIKNIKTNLLGLISEIDLQIKMVEDYRNSPDVKIRENLFEFVLRIAYRLPFVYGILEKRGLKKLRNS